MKSISIKRQAGEIKQDRPLSAENCAATQTVDHDINVAQIVDNILAEFPMSRDWRSASGIAECLGYPVEQIRETIESHPWVFEISPIEPCGVKLYRPRTS